MPDDARGAACAASASAAGGSKPARRARITSASASADCLAHRGGGRGKRRIGRESVGDDERRWAAAVGARCATHGRVLRQR
ncbi:hypothetical protein M218_22070 [Burkholderia pseudomallei MSHR338]|nr:hypothetical protein M218_22070 [Burkholderia pseudomallei MSHR338]OMW37325.1 hypothetical protein AQ807_01070 [Burkholderia pseudomallei]ONA21618.1 hypothetical protein AQ879_00295 [Burkholderia pseudomallei]ONA35758.1 hypothetical protein AQ880_00680 [Burkholderia pseudomallei]ONA46291.1 hypothetical protein AQ881_30905 [Burkholderia pseudomallei]